MNLQVAKRLIVALDYAELAPALAMARKLRGLIRTVKVGSMLFTACGPVAIQRVRAMGFSVMLDLKFFDIPSTVEFSCRAAVRHRVSLLTVHASGDPAMLRAAVYGVRDEAKRLRIAAPGVLAVTVLTSVGNASPRRITAQVLRLAQKALAAGCDGVVASAQEATALRNRFGTRLRVVCPGIRPAQAHQRDQQRICTPGEALRRGADLLVIGRPIAAAANSRVATQRILDEMEAVRAC